MALGGRGGAAVSRGPEVRPGLRPGVQAEHREHHAVQRGRHEQRALPVAVGDRPVAFGAGLLTCRSVGAERAGQLPERARHLDPQAGRVHRGDLEPQAGERPPDQVHVGRIGPVLLGELVTGQDGGALDDVGGNHRPRRSTSVSSARSEVSSWQAARARERRPLTAGQLNQGFGFFRHGQLLL